MAKSYLYSLVLGFSMVFNATAAFAVVEYVDPFDGVECIGGGEQDFCVQEIPSQYQVTNNLEASVSAFGVTNLETSSVSTWRPNWDAFSITSTAWDAGYEFSFWGNGVSTTDFGSFATLFGTDPAVNFYFLSDYGGEFGNDDWSIVDETDPSFYFNTDAASDVTAFNSGAQVVFTTSSSSVAAVPEPETYAMLLAGLGLLGWAKRRQQV